MCVLVAQQGVTKFWLVSSLVTVTFGLTAHIVMPRCVVCVCLYILCLLSWHSIFYVVQFAEWFAV